MVLKHEISVFFSPSPGCKRFLDYRYCKGAHVFLGQDVQNYRTADDGQINFTKPSRETTPSLGPKLGFGCKGPRVVWFFV